MDEFKASRSPNDLQAAQDYIRRGLLSTRAQLRKREQRRLRRRGRISSRTRRKPELGPLVRGHIELLKLLEVLLHRRRYILRASADGLVWIAFAHAPSAIRRLFRSQDHDLPDQLGLIGHVAIQEAAHKCGRFLVLENDLTRCLGVGDLTLLSLEEPSLPPLSLEVKTSVDAVEVGAPVQLRVAFMEIDDPRARAVVADFESVVGLGAEEPTQAKPFDERQLASMFEQSTAAITSHGSRSTLGVVTGNWEAVARVVGRAMPGQPALDLAEPGVWIAAISQRADGALLAADIDRVSAMVQRLIPKGANQVSAHTGHLEEHDATGALAMPVPTWPLSLSVRAKILNADLILFSVVDLGELKQLLRDRGIELSIEAEEWICEREGREWRLERSTYARVLIDGAFGGLNLRSFADRLHDLVVRESP